MYTGEQKKDGNSCGYTLDKCNTQDYVNELNKQKYCGYSDWYVPTRAEINTILHFDEESFVDPIFEMGEKYCILDYDDDPIASFSFYFIKDDRLKYIWDYFYSPEEIRLLKLKSL